MLDRMLVVIFLAAMICANSLPIPFIQNAMLVSLSSTNNSILHNHTCKECLCTGGLSYSALNCLANGTCQFFSTVPRTYRIQSTSAARLYFPQQILPNVSRCCMPDLNLLLSKLHNATRTSVNISKPRCLAIDNHGYIVTMEQTAPYITRFNATDLTLVSRTSIPTPANVWGLTYRNETYYITTNANTVVILDSNNLTLINTITSPNINNPRDVMFLNDSQTMVVASFSNDRLLFFQRSSSVTVNYSLAYQQLTPNNRSPHGIWRVNDTFFYVTSWFDNKISSYTVNSSNSSLWTETLTINNRPTTPTSGGSHIIIDECERRWFLLESYGIYIYDIDGNLIGNFTLPNTTYFTVLITDSYVIYLTDNVKNQIIKIDPHIQC